MRLISNNFLSLSRSFATRVPLVVETADPSTYQDLAIRIGSWKREANQKALLASARPREKDYFKDSALITGILAEKLEHPKFLFNETILFCKDSCQKIQAIASVEFDKPNSDDAVIQLLATHPGNIRSSLNPHSITGSATALMKAIEQECAQRNKKGILLQPLDLATLFYARLGYKPIGKATTSMYKELGYESQVKSEKVA